MPRFLLTQPTSLSPLCLDFTSPFPLLSPVLSPLPLSSPPDKKNASHSLCTITQSGLGLPDRDYYFDSDKQEKREKYKEYISAMFQLLGQGCASSGAAGGVSSSATLSVFAHRYQSKEQCDSAADAVVGLEMMLADAHLTRTGNTGLT